MRFFQITLLLVIAYSGYGIIRAFAQKPQAADTARVVRIVDGDTIHVLLDGKYETVRIIGMNAPELIDENARNKCLAEKAKKKAEDLIGDLTVTLEPDSTQADRDKYNRLLRYVLWNNGNFSEYMIKQGFAYEYTYDKPYKYQKEFKKAQKYAQESKWGIWDGKECK